MRTNKQIKNAEYQKKFRDLNKAKIKKYNDNWKASQMDKKYVVYVLPAEDYVGFTSSYNQRMSQHKSNGMNIDHAHIVGQYDDKETALRYEASIQASIALKGTSSGLSNYRHISYNSKLDNYSVTINQGGAKIYIGTSYDLNKAIELRNNYYNENQ